MTWRLKIFSPWSFQNIKKKCRRHDWSLKNAWFTTYLFSFSLPSSWESRQVAKNLLFRPFAVTYLGRINWWQRFIINTIIISGIFCLETLLYREMVFDGFVVVMLGVSLIFTWRTHVCLFFSGKLEILIRTIINETFDAVIFETFNSLH